MDDDALRIGDRLIYNDEMNEGWKLVVDLPGTATMQLPGKAACNALVIDTLLTGEFGATDPPTETRMCLDISFDTRSLERGMHGVTKQDEWRVSAAAWGWIESLLICSLSCRGMGPDGIRLESIRPPDMATTYEFRAQAGSPEYIAYKNNTWMARGEESTHNETIRFRLGERAYPDSFKITQASSFSNLTNEWAFRLDRFEPGSGEMLDFALESARHTPLAAKANTWRSAPVEGTSPFTYPQASALAHLDEEAEFTAYMADHPGAYVAAAHYIELHDEEDGQSEYLWGFVWQAGAHAFTARCHLLVSLIPQTGLDLPSYAYEEEECFDIERFELPARDRDELPEHALSWEQGVALWRSAMGSDEPVTEAHWTTFQETLNFGQPPTKDLVPSERITLVFNYNAGTFDTNPYQPTWLLGAPPFQSRAMPGSYSFIDGETAMVWSVVSLLPLSLESDPGD